MVLPARAREPSAGRSAAQWVGRKKLRPSRSARRRSILGTRNRGYLHRLSAESTVQRWHRRLSSCFGTDHRGQRRHDQGRGRLPREVVTIADGPHLGEKCRPRRGRARYDRPELGGCNGRKCQKEPHVQRGLLPQQVDERVRSPSVAITSASICSSVVPAKSARSSAMNCARKSSSA